MLGPTSGKSQEQLTGMMSFKVMGSELKAAVQLGHLYSHGLKWTWASQEVKTPTGLLQ